MAIIHDKYKYIYNKRTGIEELYDLQFDPTEEYSIMEDYIFDDETNNVDTINYDFEEEVSKAQGRNNAINELLSCLNKREYRVLQAYFGLNGAPEKTLEEISKEINLTPERVRQIKDTGIEKLQFKAMTNKSYAEFKDLY